MISARLRQRVVRRAAARCEYCCLHQDLDVLPHHVDHIIARKHRGPNSESNLALACVTCSLAKGPNIAGRDPHTGRLTRLFNPRSDEWIEHFRWRGPRVVGKTAIGRTTVAVLNMNQPERMSLRIALIADGLFPPDVSP